MKQVYDLSYLDTTALIYLVVLAAILGLCMGSSLNCAAYRIANRKSWAKGKSICPYCHHELHFLDLIPLFSWLFLKGKCRYCGKKISIRYPLSELILAITYVAVFLKFGFTIATVNYLVLFSCLFTLSLVDYDTMEIPNRFLIVPAICECAFCYYIGGWSNVWTFLWHGLALGGAVFILSVIMDKLFKKDSMGGGDIKLLALLGFYLTIPGCFLLLVMSCIIGIAMALIINRRRVGKPFPFGPALSIAMLLTLLLGDPILSWYLSLF